MPERGDTPSEVVATDVRYATPVALSDAWTQDLSNGALFCQGDKEFAPGDRVRLRLELAFCDASVELTGAVVATVPPAMASTGAVPGASIQLDLIGEALRAQLEEASGLALEPPTQDDERRRSPRFPARTPVVLELMNRHFAAETANVSYNGTLVVLPGLDLSLGTQLTAILFHPKHDTQIALPARVMNRTPCDRGMMAIGLQFQYEMNRVDEVAQFVDDVRSFLHAEQLGTLSGSLVGTTLEDVLETFSGAAREGTLLLQRGDDTGTLIYVDREIVRVETGMVSGTKALNRMFTWTDARFDFEPSVKPGNYDDAPLPLESSVLTAAVHRDEMARLEVGRLLLDAGFKVDDSRLGDAEGSLDKLQTELVEHARMGFPLGAVLDMLPESDATIYQAIAQLVGDGVLIPEEKPAK
ncbi:MAG: PilZ domain-containing protein [Proteobacteria bacterium]|nr:PilZ domain-containing protein [Pseudomonadota bacterium]